MPTDPGDVKGLVENVGLFLGGLAAAFATRFGLRTKEEKKETHEIVLAIGEALRRDGEATRTLLSAIRTDLAILLDRDDHHRGSRP